MDPLQALSSALVSVASVLGTLAAVFRWYLPRRNNSSSNDNPGDLLREIRKMSEADMKHHEREEAFWAEFRRTLERLERKP